MSHRDKDIRLLLVDDEDEFRLATAAALLRRGFFVRHVASGKEAVEEVRSDPPEVVILDLKMPGMDGIRTLEAIRELAPDLPVTVLTGHGNVHDAYAGIRLEIVDFLQKPVDIDLLAQRIRSLLTAEGGARPLTEPVIAELMVSPDDYPHLYVDQSAEEAFHFLTGLFVDAPPDEKRARAVRSALVFERDRSFVGMVRFSDLLKLVVPSFLITSPYPSFYTGMFLAQAKVAGKRAFIDIMGRTVTVDINAPLMQAVHLMITNRLVSIPVMDQGELVGVLRDRSVVCAISRHMPSLERP